MKAKLLLIVFAILTVNTIYGQQFKKEYHDNGNVESIGMYNYDGEKIGEWKEYYENGQLSSIGRYEKGKETGEWKLYYNDGNLWDIGFYRAGLKIGEWKTYHSNGQLIEIGNYKEDEKTGEWKYYDKEGNLIAIGKYVNDEKVDVWKSFYESGKLKAIVNYLDGKKNGEWKEYHSNGKLSLHLLMKNDKFYEIINIYDSNGKSIEKGSLKNGNGTVYIYDADANLLKVYNFENGKFIGENKPNEKFTKKEKIVKGYYYYAYTHTYKNHPDYKGIKTKDMSNTIYPYITPLLFVSRENCKVIPLTLTKQFGEMFKSLNLGDDYNFQLAYFETEKFTEEDAKKARDQTIKEYQNAKEIKILDFKYKCN